MGKKEERLIFPMLYGNDSQGLEIGFSAYVDMIKLRRLAAKAMNNKKKQSRAGGLRVVITRAPREVANG